RTTFPTGVTITANPLAKPTTALVMAEFYDGTPALAWNKLGKGAVLLLNWHAENEMPPAVAQTVKLTLGIWTTSGAPVHLTTTAANRQEYGNSSLEAARTCLTRLGYRPSSIPAENIDRLTANTVLVLPAVYVIPESTAHDLEQYVRKGGKLLIIDGPVRSMKLAALQHVTGFAASGRYLRRDDVIRSTGRSPLAPKGKHQMNLTDWKRRMSKWGEFRRLGVTELVRDVYRRAKGLKPNVQVTAAVLSTLDGADSAYQEWPRWLREKTIDYVIPMAYTEDTAELGRQIAQWKTVDPSLQRIIPGLSIYQDSTGRAVPRDAGLVRRQHDLCRQQGTHGNLYFSLEHLSAPLMGLLGQEFYPADAPVYVPPRHRP
ncbi:MAG: family 10 glycosylhydrolase, partial [Planctomycetes bacterium]|nr:family 10 glycosylhydrolase [Planctomycetota bacterium]